MQAPMSRPMERIQNGYRRIMPGLLKHKAIIMIASVIIVIATYFLASGMETELMTADDTGTVSVSIETRPGLLSENADAMLTQAEEIVKGHPDVESYMLRYNCLLYTSGMGTVSLVETVKYVVFRLLIHAASIVQNLEYRGNKALLNQVWINLIDNAIKFSPQNGKIKLKLHKKKDQVVFQILDNGCGMDEDTKNHIFDRFY